MFETVISILGKILDWLFNLRSEERKRRRDISNFARVLKIEIGEIREEVEERKGKEM